MAANEDELLRLPWRLVSIDGCQLLVKTRFGETAYHLILTDLQDVWEEKMETEAIRVRATELNRRLRASVGAFFSHLCEVAEPCLRGSDGPARIDLTRHDGALHLRLKSELAGLPFHWEFHCGPASCSLVCGQLVRPLLVMSHLLQQQVEQLASLLRRKDEEIQDYQENGATLSRERLQTEAFQENVYRENFMAEFLPLAWSHLSDARGFNADLRELYTAAVLHRTAPKRKPSEEVQPAEPETEPLPADPEPAEDQDRPVEPSRPPKPAAAVRLPSKPKKKKVGLFR